MSDPRLQGIRVVLGEVGLGTEWGVVERGGALPLGPGLRGVFQGRHTVS